MVGNALDAYGADATHTPTQFRQAEKDYQRTVKEIFRYGCVRGRISLSMKTSLYALCFM